MLVRERYRFRLRVHELVEDVIARGERPLLWVIDDSVARERMIAKPSKCNEELSEERSEGAEAQILMVIRKLVAKGQASGSPFGTSRTNSRRGSAMSTRVA